VRWQCARRLTHDSVRSPSVLAPPSPEAFCSISHSERDPPIDTNRARAIGPGSSLCLVGLPAAELSQMHTGGMYDMRSAIPKRQTLEQNGDLNVAERRRAPDTDPDRSNTCRNLILRAPGGRLRQTSAAMTCEGGARRCDAPGVTGGRAGVAPDRFRR